MVKAGTIVALTVVLVLMGVLLPIALSDIGDYDGTYTYVDPTNSSAYLTGTNTTVATLVSSVIPIIAIIAIVLMFVGGAALSKKGS